MAVLSKSFGEFLGRRSCNELLHPHSCRRAVFDNLFRFTLSNAKYYLPVVLLHLIKNSLRNGSLDMRILLDALWYHLQLVFGGVLAGAIITTSMCSLRNRLGKFHLYTFLVVPSILGGAACVFVPERVKHMQYTGIYQALIESLLLHSNPLSRLVSSSLILQTAIFMACSAVILEGKQRGWYRGFWFLTPNDPGKLEDRACSHSELNCGLYIVRGVRKYLVIGLAFDVFKFLVSSSRGKQWNLKQLSLQSTAWLGCYVGLYRSLDCCLRQSPRVKESLRHPLAAFLAGLSYLFYPKHTILSYALLEAIRTLTSRHSKNHKFRKPAKHLGYSDLFFPLALAYLIHNYVLKTQKVSALAGVIIDSTTANYAVNISKRVARLQ